VPNIQEKGRRKVREMLAEMRRKSTKKVLEHTGAMLLQLRVDCHCLKYKERREQIERKGESGRL